MHDVPSLVGGRAGAGDARYARLIAAARRVDLARGIRR
jgi:hypothetical protein